MKLFEFITDRYLKQGKEPVRLYRGRVGKFQGWVSVAGNSLLFVIKFILGLLIGSISLMADAVHTLSDVISSSVVIWGFKESEKPADPEHPYGHGRAEYVATLVIAILLVVTGIEFIQGAFHRITSPKPINPTWWAIIAVASTIVLKELMARFAEHLSTKIASGTLHADAWHHRSDAISSGLVVMAMVAGKYGYNTADGWFGMGVALFIIWTGIEIARDAIDDLIGKPPPQEELNEIRELAIATDGVLGAHDISVHSYGQDKFISVHIELDANISSARAHDISENVESKILTKLGSAPTVHIDPISPDHPIVKSIETFLGEILEKESRITGYHDVRVVDTEEHHLILFGLKMENGLTRKETIDICHNLEKKVINLFPEFEPKIKLSNMHLYS